MYWCNRASCDCRSTGQAFAAGGSAAVLPPTSQRQLCGEGTRSNLKRKFLDIENAIRHSIKAFGFKVGRVSRGQFETRVRDLVADDPLISRLTECMLRACAALWQEYLRLHQVVVAMVARDETCACFMRIPGVGPISALAFKAAVDDPRRFRRSRTVGAYLGLTSRRWQSGASIDIKDTSRRQGTRT